MINLDNYQLLTIFVVSLVVILGASEIGRLLGVRATGRGGSDVSTLEGATLGLLALMIGFTFAMALSRFDSRRDAVLNEANSIGTTALRARMLPKPYGAEALKSLREYVQIRLEIVQRPRSVTEEKAAIDRSNEIQEALWNNAMALAATDRELVPTGLYIQSLNKMIDEQGKRLVAIYGRVPNIVVLTLYVVAIAAFIFVGYANELQKRRLRLPIYVMGVLVSAVILLIQDLDRPNTGFIRVSQQPMVDTAASIAAHAN
jgi:CDP-diglyceride synthetase